MTPEACPCPPRWPGGVRVAPGVVFIVAGVLPACDGRLRGLCDIKIFVYVGDGVRCFRRLRRDTRERGRTVDTVIDQYLATVRPMHLEFVEPSKRYADVILPEGGFNRIGIEMIQGQVERELQRRRSETGAVRPPPEPRA